MVRSDQYVGKRHRGVLRRGAYVMPCVRRKAGKTTVAGTRSHDSAGAENGKQVRNAAADRSVHRKQHRSIYDVADFRSEDAESLRLVASLCMEIKRTDEHDVCESH